MSPPHSSVLKICKNFPTVEEQKLRRKVSSVVLDSQLLYLLADKILKDCVRTSLQQLFHVPSCSSLGKPPSLRENDIKCTCHLAFIL